MFFAEQSDIDVHTIFYITVNCFLNKSFYTCIEQPIFPIRQWTTCFFFGGLWHVCDSTNRMTSVVIPLDDKYLFFTPNAPNKSIAIDDQCIFSTELFTLVLRPRDINFCLDMIECEPTAECDLVMYLMARRQFKTLCTMETAHHEYTHVLLLIRRDDTLPLFLPSYAMDMVNRYFIKTRYFCSINKTIL